MSDAKHCDKKCGSHRKPCLLMVHTNGPHHCDRCPWPADRRMVRRAAR